MRAVKPIGKAVLSTALPEAWIRDVSHGGAMNSTHHDAAADCSKLLDHLRRRPQVALPEFRAQET